MMMIKKLNTELLVLLMVKVNTQPSPCRYVPLIRL